MAALDTRKIQVEQTKKSEENPYRFQIFQNANDRVFIREDEDKPEILMEFTAAGQNIQSKHQINCFIYLAIAAMSL